MKGNSVEARFWSSSSSWYCCIWCCPSVLTTIASRMRLVVPLVVESCRAMQACTSSSAYLTVHRSPSSTVNGMCPRRKHSPNQGRRRAVSFFCFLRVLSYIAAMYACIVCNALLSCSVCRVLTKSCLLFARTFLFLFFVSGNGTGASDLSGRQGEAQGIFDRERQRGLAEEEALQEGIVCASFVCEFPFFVRNRLLLCLGVWGAHGRSFVGVGTPAPTCAQGFHGPLV